MMNEIWEFTGEESVFEGRVLKRIRLAKNCRWGKIGEIGGWIEKEENLSGDAWVADNAKVYDGAKVKGSALISGFVRVFGQAKIYDNVRITDFAKIDGRVKLTGQVMVGGFVEMSGVAVCADSAVIRDNTIIRDGAIVNGVSRVCRNAVVTRPCVSLSLCWPVTFLSCGISIGHWVYPAKEWERFTDEEIDQMDEGALEFWRLYKAIILEMARIQDAQGY